MNNATEVNKLRLVTVDWTFHGIPFMYPLIKWGSRTNMVRILVEPIERIKREVSAEHYLLFLFDANAAILAYSRA